MATAGDAIAGAEAARNKPKRISDYLGDSDGGEASRPFPETPPQLQLPRFTCARFRFVRIGRKRGGGGRKELAAEKSEDASVDSSGSKQAGSSSASSAEAGLGLSMLLLLARTCVELNRMAEVRAQMEALLKEMRDEASKMRSADHGVAAVAPRTCDLQSSSSSAASSSCTSDTNTNRHATSYSATENTRREDEDEKENKPSEDEGGAGMEMDLLEAEFETEPAQLQRLDFKCNTEEEEETSESSDDEFIELDGGRFGGGSSGCDLKRDVGDDESEEESTDAREGGVSAIELERRLHELRHRRDRERIAELETALRRAEQKLREKEMEARMWQDTATLALQQPPRDGQ